MDDTPEKREHLRKIIVDGSPEVAFLTNKIKEMSAREDELDDEIANLKKDLKLNAHMMAKQCDMARDAEIETMKVQKELDTTKADLLFLQKEMTQMLLANGQPRDAFSWGMRVSEESLQKMAKGEA